MALTFAHPVTLRDYRPRYRQMEVEYNPFAEPDADRVSSFTYDYYPFA